MSEQSDSVVKSDPRSSYHEPSIQEEGDEFVYKIFYKEQEINKVHSLQ